MATEKAGAAVADSEVDLVGLGGELVDASVVDPVLKKKMALINAAIDEIGMTPWQWKLFGLNGFGYTVDSLLISCQVISQTAVTKEFNYTGIVQGVSLASQVGLLIGAAVWGFSADIIGRKFAFNSSLFLCAVFVLLAGAMPNYTSFCTLVAIYSAGAGGNYILDATNFVEFLPVSHAWLVTFMALWWAVGYTIVGLLAWWFMSDYSCPTNETVCARSENMGWRYLHFTSGGLVIVMALVRVFAVRMAQTPRWLISQNEDEKAFTILAGMAHRYSRPLSLTLEQLQAQGRVRHTDQSAWSAVRLWAHFSELFSTRKLAYSTTMIIINWLLIGTVSPLYNVFLPYYLESHGADTGSSSNYITWRDYAINQISGLVGPVIAAGLIETRWLGRRGTLAIGAAITTALQIGYTQIVTEAQNVGMSAAISAASNIYYGTIYAYTPEILPTAHRATGYSICVVMNRIGGIIGVLVGSYANIRTNVPLFICAGLYGALVITSLLLPFESRGKRSM